MTTSVPDQVAVPAGARSRASAAGLTRLTSVGASSSENGSSRRTRKRLASHRVGCEGRIAHLKREYGGGRSRLKGEDGARIWASWTALAYNFDTVSRLLVKAGPQA